MSNISDQASSQPTARPRVLFVDDEPYVLEGIQRSLYKEFHTDVAAGGEEGLRRLQENGPYCVVVSDMRMPGMDGAEFLSKVHDLVPDTVRVMLTGYADVQAAMRAVNQGRIFRFLNKPVSPEELIVTLRACIDQYRLAHEGKEVLENTLADTVRVMTDVLSLTNPVAFGKGSRIRQYVKHMAAHLGLKEIWQFEIAAMLSQLGCVTLTPDLLEAVHAGQPLSPEDQQRFNEYPAVGHDLLMNIPRLESVAEMIRMQNEPIAKITAASAEMVQNGAQLLKIGLAFDRSLSAGATKSEALEKLSGNPQEYVQKFVSALADPPMTEEASEARSVNVLDLRNGMIISEDLRTKDGVLLVVEGQELTFATVRRIQSFIQRGMVEGEVRVAMPSAASAAAGKS
jgi:CheY-like chemotaxis protein